MLNQSNSILSILNLVIDRVELDLEKYKLNTVEIAKSIITLSDSSFEEGCRICYDSSRLAIIYPCKCKGSIRGVHLSCLERWLEEGNRDNCELCGFHYEIERTLRYNAVHSMIIWIYSKPQIDELYERNLRYDIIRFILITPLTISSSYLCIVAADFYSTNNYNNFPPARWTTYSLLAIIILIIFSYFTWTYMVLQYHQKLWYYWWQKTSKVRLKHHQFLMGGVSKNPTKYYCTMMNHGISPV